LFGGTVVTAVAFAFANSLLTLPANPTWAERFENGLIGAAIGLGGVLLLIGGAYLFLYWRSKGAHKHWTPYATLTEGNMVSFDLRRGDGDDARLESATALGVMECRARGPARTGKTWPDRELITAGEGIVVAQWVGAGPGEYKVAWYHRTQGQRWFSEITRATFSLDVADGHLVPPHRDVRWTRR
jgi:hypothetical protein